MPPSPFRPRIQFYDGDTLFLEGDRDLLPRPEEGQTLLFTNQATGQEQEFTVLNVDAGIPYREHQESDGTVRREPLMGWATVVQMTRVGR